MLEEIMGKKAGDAKFSWRLIFNATTRQHGPKFFFQEKIVNNLHNYSVALFSSEQYLSHSWIFMQSFPHPHQKWIGKLSLNEEEILIHFEERHTTRSEGPSGAPPI